MTVLAVDLPNPLSPIIDAVTDVGADAGKAALNAILNWIATSLADACTKVAAELFHFMDASSTVNLDQGWWAGPRAQALLGTVGEIALVLLLLFVLLGVLQGVLAGDPGAVMRVVAKETPAAVFGFVATTAVASVLLKVTDAASSAVLAGSPDSLGRFAGGFGQASTALTGGLLAMLLFGLFLVGALLVWIELVIRSSLLYLLLAMSSLALAARVWPPARGVWRRLCELGIALIISKFVIALALALGAAALGGGGPQATGDLGTQAGVDAAGLLTGGTLMLLAAFSPFVLLRLIPVAEAAVVSHGVSRGPARAVGAAAVTTSTVRSMGGRAAMSGAAGSAGASGAASAAGPAAAATMAASAVPRAVSAVGSTAATMTDSATAREAQPPLGARR